MKKIKEEIKWILEDIRTYRSNFEVNSFESSIEYHLQLYIKDVMGRGFYESLYPATACNMALLITATMRP